MAFDSRSPELCQGRIAVLKKNSSLKNELKIIRENGALAALVLTREKSTASEMEVSSPQSNKETKGKKSMLSMLKGERKEKGKEEKKKKPERKEKKERKGKEEKSKREKKEKETKKSSSTFSVAIIHLESVQSLWEYIQGKPLKEEKKKDSKKKGKAPLAALHKLGFSKEDSKKAMEKNHQNVHLAAGWLHANQFKRKLQNPVPGKASSKVKKDKEAKKDESESGSDWEDDLSNISEFDESGSSFTSSDDSEDSGYNSDESILPPTIAGEETYLSRFAPPKEDYSDDEDEGEASLPF